jgi:alkyldihydroxyacetonephosphate synthase
VPLFGKHRGGGASDEKSDERDPFERAPEPEAGGGALPEIPPREDRGAPAEGLFSRAVSLLAPGGSPARRLAGRLRSGAINAVLSRPRLVNGLAGPLAEKVSRKGCRLIIGLEGSRIRTEVEARLVMSELERAGANDLGEEPGRHWFEHRYDVSYKMSPVFRGGLFVDTMEVASTWERLMDLYRAVRQAIAERAVVMAHFSHAYPEGCSIYFTFFAPLEEAERTYDAIWQAGMAAASRVGGTISHHHGVGLLKGPAMLGEHREAMALLRALKASFDPDGIMNPGKLGLPAALHARRA